MPASGAVPPPSLRRPRPGSRTSFEPGPDGRLRYAVETTRSTRRYDLPRTPAARRRRRRSPPSIRWPSASWPTGSSTARRPRPARGVVHPARRLTSLAVDARLARPGRLLRIGWQVKRQGGSHTTLSRPGWPDYVWAFHEGVEIGPRRSRARPRRAPSVLTEIRPSAGGRG